MASDRKAIAVDVPEWGGTVNLVSPTAADSERYQFKNRAALEKAAGGPGDGIVMAELVCLCLCDESGNRLFGDSEVAGFAHARGALVVERLWRQCLDLVGLSEKSRKDAEGN